MFSKIDVNGEDRHPLYAKLIAAAPKPLRRKEAVFMNAWPAKAARFTGRYPVEF
jgi:glutathione peroxidase